MSTRTAVVTGANKGLGYFTAEALARAGWRTVLVGRSEDRLTTARSTLLGRVPAADCRTLVMDLSSLTSISETSARLIELSGNKVDLLINNAGIVHSPETRQTSLDGFELVMATNLIGQVALTDALFESLAPDARIIWLGSLASRISDSPLTDFYSQEKYKPWTAYAQSKIAVQVFAYELARRFRAGGLNMLSVIVDPGYSLGGLTERVPGINNPDFRKGIREYALTPFAQGKHTGAVSLIHAATAPQVRNSDAWGPRWWTKGEPRRRALTKTSRDPDVGLRVWQRAITDAGATHLANALDER